MSRIKGDFPVHKAKIRDEDILLGVPHEDTADETEDAQEERIIGNMQAAHE